MDWNYIVKSNAFSDDLIERYPEDVPWSYLCVFHEMSIETMTQFTNKLDWFSVSNFQALDKEFIEKYQHILSLPKLLTNTKISQHLKKFITELIEKNDDPSHHKRWDNNLKSSKTFCPKTFRPAYSDYNEKTLMAGTDKWITSMTRKKKSSTTKKVSTKKQSPKRDYSGMTKDQLKEILKERKVRYMYHDTLDILRKKCIESD